MEQQVSNIQQQLEKTSISDLNFRKIDKKLTNLQQQLETLDNILTLDSNFDPMSDHYNSQANSFIPGISGNLGQLASYKKLENSDKIKLFITNVPQQLSKNGLRNIFQVFGEVLEATIKCNDDGQRFGFVVYDHLDTAASAIHGVHLRQPHNLNVKFSDSNKIKGSQDEPEDQPVTPFIPAELPKFNLPSEPSDHRSKFMNSDWYKSNHCNLVGVHNKFIKKLAQKQKVDVKKRLVDHQKKLTAMTYEDISKNFEHNGLEKYNQCDFCLNPAMYSYLGGNMHFCSLYCQDKRFGRK